MPVKSAISAAVTTITRTFTVAAGVFAPGHLGELTQVIPFELVDSVLADARAGERRLRALPSRVGVYFVLALGLFPRSGYRGVWAELTAALDGLGLAAPRRRRCGSCAAAWAGPVPGAVRGAGRPGGLAADPRGDVRPVPQGRLRRLKVHQGG